MDRRDGYQSTIRNLGTMGRCERKRFRPPLAPPKNRPWCCRRSPSLPPAQLSDPATEVFFLPPFHRRKKIFSHQFSFHQKIFQNPFVLSVPAFLGVSYLRSNLLLSFYLFIFLPSFYFLFSSFLTLPIYIYIY